MVSGHQIRARLAVLRFLPRHKLTLPNGVVSPPLFEKEVCVDWFIGFEGSQSFEVLFRLLVPALGELQLCKIEYRWAAVRVDFQGAPELRFRFRQSLLIAIKVRKNPVRVRGRRGILRSLLQNLLRTLGILERQLSHG